MHTLDPKRLSEKLDSVLDSLICGSELNVGVRVLLKCIEDRSCLYYYALEKFTFLEQTKFVATKEGFSEFKNILGKTHVNEFFARD